MNTWKIDPFHSEIKFKVKHLVVSTVSGLFKNFDATIEAPNDDFENAKVTFEADVNSIETRNEMRDNHLKSADFFDAANFPKLTFVSKTFAKTSEDEYELVGDITIRGTTKEIRLNVTFNGMVFGMDGIEVAGFEMQGKLKRLEFGLNWNSITEAGGIIVSDEIRLEISAEMKKQPVEVSAAA